MKFKPAPVFTQKEREKFLGMIIPGDGCWGWRGKDRTNGYAVFYLGMKGRYLRYKAHRLAYVLFKGEIPKGKVVIHSCDNRICTNPFHLSIGTQKDNIQDALKKGRMKPGPGRPKKTAP